MNIRYRKEVGFAGAFIFVALLYFIVRYFNNDSIDLVPALFSILVIILVITITIIYIRMY